MKVGDTVKYTGPHGGMGLLGRTGEIRGPAPDETQLPADIATHLANSGEVIGADEDWWVVRFPSTKVGEAEVILHVPEPLLSPAKGS